MLSPDEAVLDDMVGRLAAVEDLSRYPFAEQDFLNEYYRDRWQPLPYIYNALKTLPHQHPQVAPRVVKRLVQVGQSGEPAPLPPQQRGLADHRHAFGGRHKARPALVAQRIGQRTGQRVGSRPCTGE